MKRGIPFRSPGNLWRGRSKRRLSLECLEVRLAPALLAPGADVVAEARYYAATDGPNQTVDPVHAQATAAAGPILFSFQTSALSDAQVGGPVLSHAEAGGADAGTVPPTDTFARSVSNSTTNWIVTGPFTQGQLITIDVAVNIDGRMGVSNDPLILQGQILSSARAKLDLAGDFGPDQTLLDATAELSPAFNVTGPWTLTQVNPFVYQYTTSYSATIPITVPALEPFSLSASLETEAATAFTFEWFSFSDFETTGGFSYSLSTSVPGASIASPGTIDGRLWNDQNANEIQDANEPPLSGFRVFLDLDHDGVFDSATEPSALTDTNGIYSITNLSSGVYDVTLELPAGWEQTAPLDTSGNPIVDSVPVSDGVISTARPYGARARPAEVSGVLWHDQNGDNVRDGFEPGLQGWTVFADLNQDGQAAK